MYHVIQLFFWVLSFVAFPQLVRHPPQQQRQLLLLGAAPAQIYARETVWAFGSRHKRQSTYTYIDVHMYMHIHGQIDS